MVEALRILLGSVVVLSLCAIACYVAGFVVLSVLTVCGRGRSDPLSENMDQVLEEILGRSPAVEPTLQQSPGGRRP